ncbi:MAG: TonB-dependent receptor, partial [Spirochaetales bacterium]|nr:TonB-dependent receptor [Spirochaetales bacterium]
MRYYLALSLIFVISMFKVSFAQEGSSDVSILTQTLRGTVVDTDSDNPIFGANIVIKDSQPLMGTSTDENGKFRLEKVPVGRVTLEISSLGYEPRTVPNVVVTSGKEVVLNITLQENFTTLSDVTVSSSRNKGEVLNEMATVSARTFSVEETKRYAGSLNDPARMVSAFAGVTGDASGGNEIVVRGNSSKGILWRLDGIEIPNPNHFSDEGSTGGPINALNSTMLANSDFYSGAFAPEYGNAVSGVLDMKLRSGNMEKRESSANINAAGLGATFEGPFIKGKNASYLVNYRYSTVALLDATTLVDYGGIP